MLIHIQKPKRVALCDYFGMVRVSAKALQPREYVFDGVPIERRGRLRREILALRQGELEAERAEKAARLARSRAAAAAHAAGVVRQADERKKITESDEYRKLENELRILQKRRDALGKRMKDILEKKEEEDDRKAKMAKIQDGGNNNERGREDGSKASTPPNGSEAPTTVQASPFRGIQIRAIKSVPVAQSRQDNVPMFQSRPQPSAETGIVPSSQLTGSGQTIRASNAQDSTG